MSNVGISQSIYRPIEQPTLPVMRPPSGLQVLGAFLACLGLQALMLLYAKDKHGRTNLSKLAETLFWFVVIVGLAVLA